MRPVRGLQSRLMTDPQGNVARTVQDQVGIEKPAPLRRGMPWRKLALVALGFAFFVWPLRVTSHGFIVRWAPPIVDRRPTSLDPAEEGLVGEWISGWPTSGAQVSLRRDGTFRHGAGYGESAGVWKRVGNEIVLGKQESCKSCIARYPLPTFWSKDRSEDRIWVVPWGARTILFEFERELDGFVADFNGNHGAERMARWGLHRDGEPAATGRPELPSPWNERLLPGEIRGTILEVLPDGRFRASLGARDHVWVGLTLYDRGLPGKYPRLEVMEVSEKECLLRPSDHKESAELKAGDPISSWWCDADEEHRPQ